MKTTDYEKQAQDFLKETGATIKIKFKKNDFYFADDKETRDIYRINLKRDGKSYNFDFGASLNDTKLKTAPTAYDVLSALTKYDVGSFEDFCSEFGYDNDSRKAKKTYHAVLKEFQGVNYLFSDVIKKLQEIN